MTYPEYIAYHKKGDAGVEERMVYALAASFGFSRWDAFRFVYFYAMTYHIPSALQLLENPRVSKDMLVFRTDRRWVRIGDRFARLMQQLTPSILDALERCSTTTEQYREASSWYYFSRYSAFLFLETWAKFWDKHVTDDLKMKFEPEENYTKGAELVAKTKDRKRLTDFIERAKADTQDNVFSIETSLCAAWKIQKSTRWDGYYTARLLDDIAGSKWENLIISLL